MQFGELLAKRRKEANLSQEQLAEKLNVTRQAVSKWESGASMPDIETIKQISDIFSVSIDMLIYGEDRFQKKQINRDIRTQIIEPIFMAVVFVCGIVLFIISMYAYGELFQPFPLRVSLFLCTVSLLYFIVSKIISLIHHNRF